MSDKLIIYTDEGIRSWDHLEAANDSVVAVARATQLLLGGAPTVGFGFGATVQTSPNMSINIAAGQILSWQPVDNTNNAAFPPDTRMILHSGYADAQTKFFDISALTAGQSQCFLIQALFVQQDIIRVGDPTNGVLPFVNSANLLEPFAGQNNNAGTLPTVRNGFANVQVIAGAIAGTGVTPTPPTPTGGAIGLWVVTLAYGNISITSGMLSQYPNSPIVAGLLNQHHTGAAGQAPQIDLTSEVRNILGLAHLPVSNPSPPTVGGNCSVAGKIPVLFFSTVNPNGNFAGNQEDICYDATHNVLYICITTGTSGTAVWQNVGGGGASGAGPTCIYNATSPYNIANLYSCIQNDATAGAITNNMPSVASSTNAQIEVTQIAIDTAEAHTVTISPNGGDMFMVKGVIVGSITLSGLGDSRTMKPLTIPSGPTAGNYWLVT